MWADRQGLSTLARERGADYITKFFPPDPNATTTLVTLNEIGPAKIGVGVEVCESCGKRPAVGRVDRSRDGASSTRYLCAHCAILELALPGPGLFLDLLQALEEAEPEARRNMLRDMDRGGPLCRVPADRAANRPSAARSGLSGARWAVALMQVLDLPKDLLLKHLRSSSRQKPRVALDSKGVDTTRARRNVGGAPPVH